MTALSYETSLTLAQAALQKGAELGLKPLAVVVLDNRGQPSYLPESGWYSHPPASGCAWQGQRRYVFGYGQPGSWCTG